MGNRDVDEADLRNGSNSKLPASSPHGTGSKRALLGKLHSARADMEGHVV